MSKEFRVGIPRALLYHRYQSLWETFFDVLGVETVVSGETDRAVLERGNLNAIDEACLSSRIYLGHVESLIDRCDAVFVPRIANFGRRDILCTKFEALYDIVANTFRGRNIRLLDYNVDLKKSEGELAAFLRLGKKLGRKRASAFYAYMLARQAERNDLAEAVREQERQMVQADLKILIVGHSYNVCDALIGKPVLDYLKSESALPVQADLLDRKIALEQAQALTDTMPWIHNRELMGGVQAYKDRVDGIILMSAFPCGPDSLVNEILIRRVKGIPILNLLLDGQEGTAGLETRLESFLDIIRFRREAADAGRPVITTEEVAAP